jgi:hypothetical protein
MSVSHLFYGNKQVEASVNYEDFLKSPHYHNLGYDIHDKDFKELVKLMALGSKASFQYNPSDEEILKYYAKTNKLPIEDKSLTFEAIPSADREAIKKTL